MPKVQGRITVRRRPKDGTPGTPGADSVRYWIQSSATSIAMTAPEAGDATPVPDTIAITVKKQIGNQTPTNVNVASEGLTLSYMYTRNGTVGNATNLTNNYTVNIPTNTEFNNVIVKLSKGAVTLDTITVPFVYDGEPGKDGKDGKDGDDGKDGKDAITILVSPENIEFNFSKSVMKQTVKVNVYKGTTKLNYSKSEFLCSILTKSGPGTVTTGLRWNFEVDGTDFYYTFMYIAGNDIDMTIPFKVTVDSIEYERAIYVHTVKDGNQGIPGPTYMPLRVREWSSIGNNTVLTTGLGEDDNWTDIVYLLDSSVASGIRYWRCIKQFTKSASHKPPESNKDALWGYLQETTNFGSLATDIFLANYALIKNLGVETIDMRDSSGNILFYVKDGTVTCNTGNFKNIKVSGDITAEFLNLKISTKAHVEDSPILSDGSICLNASGIILPELPAGTARSMRILNPLQTRTTPSDLVLKPASNKVYISDSLSTLGAKNATLSLSGQGVNGNAYLELIGYHRSGESWTYWLTSSLNSGVAST